ncbi:hypothetical protein SAY86_004734 [Trapa natans]|uniref:Pentatricopeptide repeat-containing protein n=1 Tax=Trapa natans TaxID=22666 RepID=A0AAN7RI72_TRANT|nr:hypothetical protein SAY86_004734 [Trapa natans]
MQSLSSCPLKGDSWAIPRKKRHKRRSPLSGGGYPRSSCLLTGFGNSTGIIGSNTTISWGHSRICKLDFFGLFIPGQCTRGSVGTNFGLAWATEEHQSVSSEIHSSDGCDKIDTLYARTEIGDDKGEEEKPVERWSQEEKNGRIDVRALAESLRSARSAEDVEEVLKEKGELPLQVFSSMIKGFGRDNCMESSMAVVQWLKMKKDETNGLIRPNLFIYNSLLGAIKLSRQFDFLDKVMEDMANEGLTPNVVTYNTLMVIYIEQGQARKALDILEEIPKAGFVPTPVSYSTALMAHRRLEDGSGALKFFVEFRENFRNGKIVKDGEEDWKTELVKLENFTIRICYQVMRRWLVNDGNMSKDVLKLLTDMDKAGLELSRADLERLVWACTREEHYIVAKELYARTREGYFEISLSVCNHVIWLMGKAKKWWAALEVYEDLLDKGPMPNNMSNELIISHFNVLLSAARKRGIWRWGVQLLDKMQDKGLKPGSREWNSVLIACSKASETSAAIEIFKRMVEKGEKPTIISYGALLSALEKGRLYDEALKVWEHMIKVGVEPNLYAYTTMALILTGQGNFRRLDALIREMVSLGIEPTVVTYNAIISGCAKTGSGSSAYEWFHRMKVQGISPNEVTYEMLIEALSRDGKPRLANDLYQRANNEGLTLSLKAYDAILSSAKVYGATVDLSALGPRPPDTRNRNYSMSKEQESVL